MISSQVVNVSNPVRAPEASLIPHFSMLNGEGLLNMFLHAIIRIVFLVQHTSLRDY